MTVSDKEIVEKLIPGWGTQRLPRFIAEYLTRREQHEERLDHEVKTRLCENIQQAKEIERLTAEVRNRENALVSLAATYGGNTESRFDGSDGMRMSVECALDECGGDLTERCVQAFYDAMEIGVTASSEKHAVTTKDSDDCPDESDELEVAQHQHKRDLAEYNRVSAEVSRYRAALQEINDLYNELGFSLQAGALAGIAFRALEVVSGRQEQNEWDDLQASGGLPEAQALQTKGAGQEGCPICSDPLEWKDNWYGQCPRCRRKLPVDGRQEQND